jgi:hypothetical protein
LASRDGGRSFGDADDAQPSDLLIKVGGAIIFLDESAKKKEEGYRARHLEVRCALSQGSAILAREQASTLSFCFLFRSQAQTHLLFCPNRDG